MSTKVSTSFTSSRLTVSWPYLYPALGSLTVPRLYIHLLVSPTHHSSRRPLPPLEPFQSLICCMDVRFLRKGRSSRILLLRKQWTLVKLGTKTAVTRSWSWRTLWSYRAFTKQLGTAEWKLENNWDRALNIPALLLLHYSNGPSPDACRPPGEVLLPWWLCYVPGQKDWLAKLA